MIIVFMGPPPAHRPKRPEKPRRHQQPKYIGVRAPRTLETGTFMQKAWLATCIVLVIVTVPIWLPIAWLYFRQ